MKDRSSFAGSVATTDRLVRTMINLADIPLVQAIKMITFTPARVIGIESKKGSIGLGKDADIVVFDKDINISLVIVEREIRFNKI